MRHTCCLYGSGLIVVQNETPLLPFLNESGLKVVLLLQHRHRASWMKVKVYSLVVELYLEGPHNFWYTPIYVCLKSNESAILHWYYILVCLLFRFHIGLTLFSIKSIINFLVNYLYHVPQCMYILVIHVIW